MYPTINLTPDPVVTDDEVEVPDPKTDPIIGLVHDLTGPRWL